VSGPSIEGSLAKSLLTPLDRIAANHFFDLERQAAPYRL